MKKLIAAVVFTSVLAGCSWFGLEDEPVEVRIAAACNTLSSTIAAAKPYRALMSDESLLALKGANDTATVTCQNAKDGLFEGGTDLALFTVLQAASIATNMICEVNPMDPTCVQPE